MIQKRRTQLAAAAVIGLCAVLGTGASALAGGFGTWSLFPIPLLERQIFGETVSVKTGLPVAGVNVQLNGRGTMQSQTTDDDGQFQFVGLAPGTYILQADGGDPTFVSVSGGYDVFVTLHVE